MVKAMKAASLWRNARQPTTQTLAASMTMGERMKSVKQILKHKGYQVWSIGPSATVLEALKLMAEKNVGALTVMLDDRLIGLVTERDYARKVVLLDRSSLDTPVELIMTPRVVCTSLDRTAEECMAVMTEKRVRHLPVIEADRVIGLVSIGDLVQAIIDDQQFTIEQLEQYIAG
jgi:CBS domain-containing protein